MRRLGIVVATTAEARSLTRQPTVNSPIHLPEGPVVQVSGVGPQRASFAARALLGEGVTALLSWGCAGGLVPALPPGSLILPKMVIAADQSVFHVDASWHERLCQRLEGSTGFYQEPLAESVAVLTRPEEKRRLSSRIGAIAVDMESAAVAGVAREAGVPFAVIRALLDPVEMAIPDRALTVVDEFGRLNVLKLVKQLFEYPGDVSRLLAMRRNLRAVQTALARVLDLAGKNLLVS